MPKVVPHKKDICHTGTLREYKSEVERLEFKGEAPVQISLSDKTVGKGTCIGCHDAPCMMLSAVETILPESLDDFPGSPKREICPTRAIYWNNTGETVSINADACFGCGLCVARCPYGAISLNLKGKAFVEISDPDNLTVARKDQKSSCKHAKPLRIGYIADCSPISRQIPNSIINLNDANKLQLARNLLIECGITCRTRRIGDTNIRMDGVISLSNDRLGVLEIELSNMVLESPRALLEDIAVLHGRYGIDVRHIDPVSLILNLPNARSEYYQVIDDIEKVLEIRCRTLTVGCLLMAVWRFQKIGDFNDRLFMTTPEDTNLWYSMRQLIPELNQKEPYPGAYRPSK